MKKGLTLAETLVTLGILGVIATITMPTINTSSWKGQREALLKSAYARVKNAMDMAIQDLGYTPKCTSSSISSDSECQALGQAMTNNLRIVRKCNGTDDNCKREYRGVDDAYKSDMKHYMPNATDEKLNQDAETHTKDFKGFRTNSLENNYAFHTANNFTLINYHTSDFFHPGIFTIDTNGNKGPNKWGHDLFPFEIEYARNGKNLELKTFSHNMIDVYLRESHNGLSGVTATEILQNR